MWIETERLILRDFTMDDVKALAECRADERYWRFYDPVPDATAGAREHVELFVRRQAEVPRTNYQLAIVLKENGEFIGDVGIRLHSQVSYGEGKEHEADIGYELAPRFWGCGYATEAVIAIVQFGFENLQIHRLWAFCIGANEASWRLMERIGMQREGVLRGNTRLRGQWVDTHVYGLLETEWRSRHRLEPAD